MVTALALLLMAASPAQCRAAYQEVRLREAAVLCRSALQEARPEERPELYRLLGLSLAASGEHETAKAAFVSLLTLDPAAALPAEYAPRVRADFDAARTAGAGTPVKLGVVPPSPAVVGTPLPTTLTVDDGAGVVRELLVRAPGFEVRVPRAPQMQVLLPPVSAPGPLQLEVFARDAFSVTLAQLALQLEVNARPSRGWWRSWPVYAVAAGVAGLAGGGLGLFSRQAGGQARAATFADDRLTAQGRANGLAVGADVGLGLAGALGVVALVVGLTNSDGPTNSDGH